MQGGGRVEAQEGKAGRPPEGQSADSSSGTEKSQSVQSTLGCDEDLLNDGPWKKRRGKSEDHAVVSNLSRGKGWLIIRRGQLGKGGREATWRGAVPTPAPGGP